MSVKTFDLLVALSTMALAISIFRLWNRVNDQKTPLSPRLDNLSG